MLKAIGNPDVIIGSDVFQYTDPRGG